jgi:hypothetical protein
MKRPLSLTQNQFDYIVAQCDAILEKHASDFSIAGNAWLNVLHSHPSIQERYVHVFHKRTTAGLIKDVLRGVGVLVTDLFISFGSLFKKKGDWKKIAPETEVIFISHLVNASIPKNAPDFYFQTLPAYLQQKGYHVAVGLMNHVEKFAGWKDEPGPSNKDPEKFVLPLRLDLRSELLVMGRCMRTALFFFKQYLKEKEPLKKSFLRELSGNTLSAHTLRAYRLYETLAFIIKRTNIKTMAFTWEGHSWERMACHAAKTAPHKILAIGYQHTVLFPSSYAIKKSRGTTYDPDVILTVGSVTKDILATSPGLENVVVKEYGSPRLTEESAYTSVGPIQKACLVTPEGLVNECIALFSFAVSAARLMPETDFIFRTHPMINFADLQKEETALQDLPVNVIISSNKNIDDDFKRSSWLLYRNSSVSFFAVLAGLRPLYLQIGNEISNDVLYGLNSWRKNISTANELIKIVNADGNISPEERNREREDAYSFSKKYMVPYNVAVFEECIKEEMMHG